MWDVTAWLARRKWWLVSTTVVVAASVTLAIVMSGFRYPGVSTGEMWGAGLGAALISGVIAALVAYGVVRLTHQESRRQAAENRAEDLVVELIQAAVAEADWADPDFAFGDPATGERLDARADPTPVDSTPARMEWWSARRRHQGMIVGASVAASAALRRMGDDAMALSISGAVYEMDKVDATLKRAAYVRDLPTFLDKAEELSWRINELVANLSEWLEERTVVEPYERSDPADGSTFRPLARVNGPPIWVKKPETRSY